MLKGIAGSSHVTLGTVFAISQFLGKNSAMKTLFSFVWLAVAFAAQPKPGTKSHFLVGAPWFSELLEEEDAPVSVPKSDSSGRRSHMDTKEVSIKNAKKVDHKKVEARSKTTAMILTDTWNLFSPCVVFLNREERMVRRDKLGRLNKFYGIGYWVSFISMAHWQTLESTGRYIKMSTERCQMTRWLNCSNCMYWKLQRKIAQ
jgi:hypothetical protein